MQPTNRIGYEPPLSVSGSQNPTTAPADPTARRGFPASAEPQTEPRGPRSADKAGRGFFREMDGPPVSNTGGNIPNVVGLDWISMTFPGESEPRVHQTHRDWFGFDDPGEWGSGFNFFDQALRFGDGASILRSADRAGLIIPGSSMSPMTPHQRIGMLEDLIRIPGSKVTRLDVALDYFDAPFLSNAIESCKRGELQGAKTFTPIPAYTADGDLTGLTLYLGKRGKKGSGRFLRLYDKGLETKTLGRGEWERWEIEMSRTVSDKVARSLVASQAWWETAAGVALGAVSFEEADGTLVEWFARMVEGIDGCRVTADRTASSLEGFVEWFERCAAPMLGAMVERSGLSLGEVLEELEVRMTPSVNALRSPVLREFLSRLDA